MAVPGPTVFLGATFYIHGLDERAHTTVAESVKTAGGRVAHKLTPDVQYIVSTADVVRANQRLVLEWVNSGKPIVGPNYVEDCRRFNVRRQTAVYSLLPHLDEDERSAVSDDDVAYDHHDQDSSALPLGTSPPTYSLHVRRPSRSLKTRSSPGAGNSVGRRSTVDDQRSSPSGGDDKASSPSMPIPTPMMRSRSTDSTMLAQMAKTNLRKHKQKQKSQLRRMDYASKSPSILDSEEEDEDAVDESETENDSVITRTGEDGLLVSVTATKSRSITPTATPTTATCESPTSQLQRLHLVLSQLKAAPRASSRSRAAKDGEVTGDVRRFDNVVLWTELRAKINECTPEEEEDQISIQQKNVDELLKSILDYSPPQASSIAVVADSVGELLKHTDTMEDCFPTNRAFLQMKPAYSDAHDKLVTLRTWFSLSQSIIAQRKIMIQWIGTENMFDEDAIRQFLMRELRDVSISIIFQKHRVRDMAETLERGQAQLSNPEVAEAFSRLNLPCLIDELLDLSMIGGYIIKVYLTIRNDQCGQLTKGSLNDSAEMVRDVHESLSISLNMRQKYGVELRRAIAPDIPPSDSFLVRELLATLDTYFRALNWKWRSGWQNSSFSVGDFLDDEWTFVKAISHMLPGGDVHVVAGFCKLCEEMMRQMQNELEESDDKFSGMQIDSTPRETMKAGMRILETFRWRSRRILRFVKKLSSQLENAIDFKIRRQDLDAVINRLAEQKHSLLVNNSSRESIVTESNLQIIVSKDLHLQVESILSVFRVVSSYSTDHAETSHEDEDYYALLVPHGRNWPRNGRQTQVAPKAATELQHAPGPLLPNDTIRLVAPTAHGLVIAKKHFLRIMDPLIPPSEEIFAHAPIVNSRLLAVKKAAVALASTLITKATKLHTHPVSPIAPQPSEPRPLSYFSISPIRRNRAYSSSATLNVLTRTTSNLATPLSTTTPSTGSSSNLSFALSTDTLVNQTSYGDFPTLVQRLSDFAGTFLLDVMRFIRGDPRRALQNDLIMFLRKWVIFLVDTLAYAKESNCDLLCQAQRWSIRVLHFTEHELVKEALLFLPRSDFASLYDMLLLVEKGCRECKEANARYTPRQSLSTLLGQADAKADHDQTVPVKRQPLARVESAERRQDLINDLERRLATKQIKAKLVGRVLTGDEIPAHMQSLASSFSRTTIMRWERKSPLGSGSYGRVFKAINLDTGELMAVKLMQLYRGSNNDDVMAAICKEMLLIETLKHDHIIRYLGMEMLRQEVAVFMEYCSEGSLASVLKRDGPINTESIVQAYTHQIVDGLVYLHSASVVHCDIKPDNILIDSNGKLKLADFGSAVIKRMTNIEQPTRTRKPHDELLGTPNYMSPEMSRGTKASESSDIWALGCCVWEMITGRAPWAGMEPWSIIFSIGQDKTPEMPPPSSEKLSAEAIDFLLQCFQIDPARRPSALMLQSHAFLRETSHHHHYHHHHSHQQHHPQPTTLPELADNDQNRAHSAGVTTSDSSSHTDSAAMSV